MAYIRNSQHFIWSTSCVLGKGATGSVYQGVNEKNGESVAVKTFNHNSHMRSLEVQMREFEIMKKLDHENIVKMIAIEEELESQKKVLVMELCIGGSLFSILDDPQNSYGLEEEEFLCVLRDLSAGMKYLRENNIAHRDLKPGNIMKYISEDGRSIYKLTDFGAARELEEDQQFMSLYGTEEYLHPDMYERAVLRHSANKPFRATVDLWSIGVTLYHVATGSLPFRPFGGRKNRETMHYITTKKASGVISGVQHSENGPIEWSRELPKTCLLNQGLRDLVTVLLAGILECNDDKMWTFEKFFESATDITSRKVFHVFYMNEGKEISLYMQPNKKLEDLQEQITSQIKVPLVNQLLLFDKSLFISQIQSKSEISSFPSTTPPQPIILVHTESTEVKDLNRCGALSAVFPMFHSSSNVDHDAGLAKTCCSVAHKVKRFVVKLVRCRELLLKTPKILLSLATDNVTKLCSNLDIIKQRFDDLIERSEQLEKGCTLITQYVLLWPNQHCDNELKNLVQIVKKNNEIKEQVRQDFLPLQSAIHNQKQKVLVNKRLETEWKQALNEITDLVRCIEQADTYVNRIRDSWQFLLRNKGLRVLSQQDQKFHVLEKVKIQETSKKLLALLREQCLKSCDQASHKLDEWYSGMQATMVQCTCLENDLSSINTVIKSYAALLQEAEKEAFETKKIIILALKLSPSKSNQTNSDGKTNEMSITKESLSSGSKNSFDRQHPSHSYKNVLSQIKTLKEEQTNLWQIAEENNTIIENIFSMFPNLLNQNMNIEDPLRDNNEE